MTIYWDIFDVPEFAEHPVRKAREVWRDCSIEYPISRFIAVVIAMACGFIVSHYFKTDVLIGPTAAVVGYYFGFQIQVAYLRPKIRSYLNRPERNTL